jgi:hypothetical protein
MLKLLREFINQTGFAVRYTLCAHCTVHYTGCRKLNTAEVVQKCTHAAHRYYISLVRRGRAQRTDWRIFWKEVGVYTSQREKWRVQTLYCKRSKRRGPQFFVVVAYGQQRVFNDLQRARPSRGRMIWLLAHPLIPPIPPVSSIGDTQEGWERETACWWERSGWRGRIIRTQKSLVLFKSFNTLWRPVWLAT